MTMIDGVETMLEPKLGTKPVAAEIPRAKTSSEVIREGVYRCISGVTGLKNEEIQMKNTLIDDLKLDSIDLIDLLYQIEDAFKVQIKMGELEAKARLLLGARPFAVDNIITPEGIEILKQLIPDAPVQKFTAGLMVQQIPYLFTVSSLCNLIEEKANS